MVLTAQPSVKNRSREPRISPGFTPHTGARRGAHIRRIFIRAEPMQRLAGDGFGHGMGAVEFPVANLVACVIELRDDPSTAAIDRIG